MKLLSGKPMHINHIILVCTLIITAALIWNVQANRYRVSTSGMVLDSITLSVYDPTTGGWIKLEK